MDSGRCASARSGLGNMGGRGINLDGGEIVIIKALGLSGAPMFGRLLMTRVGKMEQAEFLDTLMGLMAQGYVVSNKVNVRLLVDVERAFFRVNPAYGRELKEALRPGLRRQEGRDARRPR